MLSKKSFIGLGTVLLLACGGGADDVDAGEQAMDAGSAGDAAADDAGADPADSGAVDPPDAGGSDSGSGQCTACIAETLRWELKGGFAPLRGANEVHACRTYKHTRMTTRGGGGGAMSCSNEVPCMGDATTIADLNAALAHADVVAAFAAAPILYGRDTRPVDGVVLDVTQGGRTFTVGSPCSGGTGCVAIPPGVTALRSLLTSLEDERLAEEDCASTFP